MEFVRTLLPDGRRKQLKLEVHFVRTFTSMSLLGVAASLVCLPSVRGIAASFTPDHLYVPSNGEVIEYNLDLTELGRFSVPGVETSTGSVFSPAGNLVIIARRQDRTRILEVGSDGATIHEFDTGNGSLLWGSYIALDKARRIFVFADDDRLTYLDENLSLIGSTEHVFRRASGVTFDANGNALATDQFLTGVFRFKPDFSADGQYPFAANVLTGLKASRDGSLLIAVFGEGAVYRYNTATNQGVRIAGEGGHGTVSDVLELPDGRILTISIGTPLRLYSPTGELLASSEGSSTGDSVAYLAPVIAESRFVRGNANDDRSVDISDVIWILQFLFYSGHPISCLAAADVNEDGALGISDATFLIDHILRGGPSPAPPYPACGIEPGGGNGTMGCENSQKRCQ